MDLQEMINTDWFTEELGLDKGDREVYESNFLASLKTRELLKAWAAHEVHKLDKEVSLSKLKATPDRGELALMVGAQREVYLKLIALIDKKGN